jgi:hypothetical protein
MTKTHWKKAFKSDYLSSSDIDDKDLILTITHVKYQECMTQAGSKFCNVAHFKEDVKPMILNVGNSKIVKKFTGNKTHLEDWLNIKIQVYVDAKVRFGNDTVEGLRIRSTQPTPKKTKAKLSPDKYQAAVEFLQNGKTMEELKGFYEFDLETEKMLIKDSKNETGL